MAFLKTDLNSTSWTLIGPNVTVMSFQNIGQSPIYISVTANTAPPSANTVGWLYDVYQAELKINPGSLVVNPGTYVWARAVSNSGRIITEL